MLDGFKSLALHRATVAKMTRYDKTGTASVLVEPDKSRQIQNKIISITSTTLLI